MITAELYKIAKHRMPYVLAAFGAIATFAPSIYFLFNQPDDPSDYTESAVAVFRGVGILLSAVYGGWLLGHEYRQGTVKRIVALDARRGRLLAAKLIAGTAGLLAVLVVVMDIGLGGAALVSTIKGDPFVGDGLARSALGAMLPMIVTAVFAFELSAILRSDTYAMLGAIATTTIFAALISRIPTVGDYSLAIVMSDVATRIAGDTEALTNSFAASAAATVAWLAVTGAIGHQIFARRDI